MLLLIVLVLSWGPVSFAQTGATLMLKPWEPEKLAEAQGSALFAEKVRTDNHADYQLSMYDSSGRVRLFPGQEASPRFGYDFLKMDLHSNDPGLPDQLYDQSVSAGLFVGRYSGWIAGVSAGVGYAGDAPFGDGNGWYYLGSIGIGKELDTKHESVLAFVLDYDGNRTRFRDFPVPGVEYIYRFDPHIRMTLGLPVTSILWTPIEKLNIEATYTLTDRFDASVTYDVTPHFSVFSRLNTRQEAFWLEQLGSHDRLLFQERSAEAGVKFSPIDQMSLIASGGYMFNQEFSAGWDTTHSLHVADIGDAWFFRVGLELQF